MKRIESQAGWMEVVARQQAARQGPLAPLPREVARRLHVPLSVGGRVLQPAQPGRLRL